MLDHGPVAQRVEPARLREHSGTQDLNENENRRLRRRIDQQETTLTHLSQALVRLRQGTEALREENRELRRELEAAHASRSAPHVDPAASHIGRIDENLRRRPS